jgi:CxxC motif-containing protein (DUF1111 family)
MKWSCPAWCLGAALLIFAPVTLRVLSWTEEEPQAPAPDDVRAGQVLFNHEWQPNDPLCAGGDGLGPVYNAASCVACHRQGGTGGGGGLEHNVTTFVVDSDVPFQGRRQMAGNLRREGVIHAHAVADKYQETLALLSPELPAISQPSLEQLVTLPGRNNHCLAMPAQIHLAQRNTPALFGAGLIDAIPDRVILVNMKKQRLRHGLAPGATQHLPVGRVVRLADGRIGKFGWKGQSATLSDFVQAACANELGLSNPNHAQPQPMGKPDYRAVGLDLTQKQCDQITAFIAALPRPTERRLEDPAQRAHALRGKGLFNQVGCADCHTPNLGSVSGIYSDLLLHRMGQDLESGGSSYGGGPPRERSPGNDPLPEEWRTPPLWGVADSAPYLHDGRAATLEEAIRMHGGQGSRAAARFGRLGAGEQAQLIAFLKTLRAPAADRR